MDEEKVLAKIEAIGIDFGYVMLSCLLLSYLIGNGRKENDKCANNSFFPYLVRNPMVCVHWPKLFSTFTNPGTVDAVSGMQFQTFHLTDRAYTPREARLWALHDQIQRNDNLRRLLRDKILPRHRNTIRHVILNTYLEVNSSYTFRETVLLLNRVLDRNARLARVDTTFGCIWFWDLKAKDGDSWTLPKDMNFWDDEIKMWQIE